MITPREQNSRHSHNIKMADKLYDNVAKFESLGTSLTNQKLQSRGKRGKIKQRKCLLPIGQESFVFRLSLQK